MNGSPAHAGKTAKADLADGGYKRSFVELFLEGEVGEMLMVRGRERRALHGAHYRRPLST